jgi:hypothetical protein
LDLEPGWIWIRIGIQLKTLDPDPDSINPDPKHWTKVLKFFQYQNFEEKGISKE